MAKNGNNRNHPGNKNKAALLTSPLPPEFQERPHGGYPKGFKYPAEEDGRRLFRVQLTPELRGLLALPAEELYWGRFYNRKSIDAASKAYTVVCRRAAEQGHQQCPEVFLPIVAPLAQTRSGPKVNRYWISRRPNPAYRQIRFSRTSKREAEYPWLYDILPEKQRHKEDAKIIRRRHSAVAKERYERLERKPSKYSRKG